MAPKAPSEADIIFNRVQIALAERQRIVESWLPPLTEEEKRNAKTEEQLDAEDREMFKPVPERLGVGATPPKDFDDLKRSSSTSMEALRKQLLGKHAKPTSQLSSTSKSFTAFPKSKPQPSKPPPRVEDSEDEEEGRASAFKSKKRKSRRENVISTDGDEEVLDTAITTQKQQAETIPPGAKEMDLDSQSNEKAEAVDSRDSNSSSKKRHSNFLDEVLAEKSSKRKKKKHKKHRSAET